MIKLWGWCDEKNVSRLSGAIVELLIPCEEAKRRRENVLFFRLLLFRLTSTVVFFSLSSTFPPSSPSRSMVRRLRALTGYYRVAKLMEKIVSFHFAQCKIFLAKLNKFNSFGARWYWFPFHRWDLNCIWLKNENWEIDRLSCCLVLCISWHFKCFESIRWELERDWLEIYHKKFKFHNCHRQVELMQSRSGNTQWCHTLNIDEDGTKK